MYIHDTQPCDKSVSTLTNSMFGSATVFPFGDTLFIFIGRAAGLAFGSTTGSDFTGSAAGSAFGSTTGSGFRGVISGSALTSSKFNVSSEKNILPDSFGSTFGSSTGSGFSGSTFPFFNSSANNSS